MTSAICLCSDLDRTILPNGHHKESPRVRHVLQRIAERPEITIVYVTGRNKALIIDAIKEFEIPEPDYAIGDVGATLYSVADGRWKMAESWTQHIGKDWTGNTGHDLAEMLKNLAELRLQEPEKQHQYKLSYYTDQAIDYRQLVEEIKQRFQVNRIRASVTWSIDEPNKLGLIDILPQYATKLHAIKFLLKTQSIPVQRTVFCGDSGNDLDALTSGLQAVLVKNAAEEVRKEAIKILSHKQMTDRLYLAQGDFYGMNGNYAAGVLEGLAHFFPETQKWIREAQDDSGCR